MLKQEIIIGLIALISESKRLIRAKAHAEGVFGIDEPSRLDGQHIRHVLCSAELKDMLWNHYDLVVALESLA